jgi:hypothetical protein
MEKILPKFQVQLENDKYLQNQEQQTKSNEEPQKQNTDMYPVLLHQDLHHNQEMPNEVEE